MLLKCVAHIPTSVPFYCWFPGWKWFPLRHHMDFSRTSTESLLRCLLFRESSSHSTDICSPFPVLPFLLSLSLSPAHFTMKYTMYFIYLFFVTFHPNVSSIRAGLAQTSGLTRLLWSVPWGAESGSAEPWAWGCQLQQRCCWLSSAREHQSLPPGTKQVWTVTVITGHLGWGRLRGSYSTLLVHHKH